MESDKLGKWLPSLFVILLTACSNMDTAFNNRLSSTSTTTPSLTPIVEPSITPSPTITITPLPPTPEGAQGFDKNRQLAWKQEGEETFYYIPELDDWVIALNQRSIWLVRSENYPGDVGRALPSNFKSMPVNYYRLPGSSTPFVSVEVPSDYNSMWRGEKFSLEKYQWHSPQERVAMILAERMNRVEEKDLTPAMLRDVLVRFNGYHEIVLPIDIPVIAKDNSDVTTKYWDLTKGVDSIQIPWEETTDDPSYFGRLSQLIHWKLEVRGGEDSEHPGKLVAIWATTRSFRFNLDYTEANVHLLGPIYPALISQELPIVDYVTFLGADLNNFGGEYVLIHKTKGISYEDLEASWHFREMEDFARSASLSAYWSAPFFDFQCIHFDRGTQTIINCYAPYEYLRKK